MRALSRALVRLAARVAPSHYRERWREEWLAELAAAQSSSPLAMLARSLGAPWDAVSAHWTVSPDPHAVTIARPTRADLMLAVRQIHQAPLLSAAAVLALAVGIGSAAFVFTFVTNVFYGDLPVPNADRIVKVHDFDQVGRWGLLLDRAEFDRRQQLVKSFSGLAAYHERTALVSAPGHSPELLGTAFVTPNLSSALGVAPLVGRDFVSGDERGPDVALISERLYERLFDRNPSALGRVLRVDERPYEIVGVMPPRWRFPMRGDVWVPLDRSPRAGAAPSSSLHVVGRLADGVEAATATAEMQAIARPWTGTAGREHVTQTVMPFTSSLADSTVRFAVWGVIAALVLLLCVSAGNVANVVLARALSRRREMAVRSALGASRARLVMQVMIEAGVLSIVAAVVGALAADLGLRWVDALDIKAPFWVVLHLDWRAVLFVVCLGLLSTIVAGLGPAIRATRGSMFDGLRETGATLRFGRLSGLLIVCETALSIALLTGTFVLTRSLAGFADHDARLPLGKVLIAQLYFGQPPSLSLPDAPTDPELRRRSWNAYLEQVEVAERRLVERISSEPGVRTLALGSLFPGNDPNPANVSLLAEGTERPIPTRMIFAGHTYLEVLETAVTSGRFFTEDDEAGQRAVAVVNEPFARKYFAGRSPIGQLVRLGEGASRRSSRDAEVWREIVGVVPDLAVNPGNPSQADAVYLPRTTDTVVRLALSASDHPLSLVPTLHRIAIDLEPRPQVQWTTTLDAQMQEPMTALRAIGLSLGTLGGVALLLSCLGTYAIVAFSVAQHRREIAIRVAMGAGPRQVVAAVLAPSARRLALGTLAGGVLGIGVERIVALVPFALAESTLGSSVAMVGLVTLSGALACAGPLRRALALRPGEWLNQ